MSDPVRGLARGTTRATRRALCLASLVLLAFASPMGATAQGDHPGASSEVPVSAGSAVVSVRDAVRLALEHNHQLTAARHAHRAALWAQRHAKAQLLPSISLESSYTRLDDETIARANAFGREITMYFPDSTGALQPVTIEIPQTVFRDGYETSVRGQLLLLNPGVWSGVALAGASEDLAAAELQSRMQSTAHQTLRAYVELLQLHSLVRLRDQHAEQARRNTEQAERLFDVGKYSEADVLRWRVEEAQQQELLTEARRALRVATLTTENLIGAVPRGALLPDSTLTARLTLEFDRLRTMDRAQWEAFLTRPVNDVIAGDPQLGILAATERLSRIEHRRSLTAFMPSVTIAGSYGWQNNDTPELDGDDTWAVSAAVSVPLFDSFANVSDYKTTQHRLFQARETVRDARRGLLLAAEAARTALHSATARLHLAETSLASARRGYEIQRNRLALGRLSNLEWIDANLALRAAEQSHTSSHYDLVLAIVDYFKATGEILDLLEE